MAPELQLKVELAQHLLARSVGTDVGLPAVRRLFVDIDGARPYRKLHVESAERGLLTPLVHDQLLAGFTLATTAIDLIRHPRRVGPLADFNASLETARRLAPAPTPAAVAKPVSASAAQTRPGWSSRHVTVAAVAREVRANVLSSASRTGWLTGTIRVARPTREAAEAVAQAVVGERKASAAAGIEWRWAKTVHRPGESTDVWLDYRVDPARLKPEHRQAVAGATQTFVKEVVRTAESVAARTRSRTGELHTPIHPADAVHYQRFIEERAAPELRARGFDVGFRLSQRAEGNFGVVWFSRL